MDDVAPANEPPPADPSEPPSTLTRRGVVRGAAAAAGLATVATFWFEDFGDPARRRGLAPTPPSAPPQAFDPETLATCAAVMDRLLPSEGADSPGARDVNAAGYLDALFARGDLSTAVQERIRTGLGRCDGIARRRFRRRRFRELTDTQQDAVLALFERSAAGVLFLRSTIEMILECFFGDPVHGGNPGEIGWTWANHIPGMPRPTTPHWRPEEQQ